MDFKPFNTVQRLISASSNSLQTNIRVFPSSDAAPLHPKCRSTFPRLSMLYAGAIDWGSRGALNSNESPLQLLHAAYIRQDGSADGSESFVDKGKGYEGTKRKDTVVIPKEGQMRVKGQAWRSNNLQYSGLPKKHTMFRPLRVPNKARVTRYWAFLGEYYGITSFKLKVCPSFILETYLSDCPARPSNVKIAIYRTTRVRHGAGWQPKQKTACSDAHAMSVQPHRRPHRSHGRACSRIV
jgi:hypothetical protein